MIEVPLIIVTLSVLEWVNMNCDDSGFSSDSASGRLAFTATKPDGDALDKRPLVRPWALESCQVSLAVRDCACKEASFSRRLTIAVRRFFRR